MDRFGPAVTGELVEAGRTIQYFRNAYIETHLLSDGSRGARIGYIDPRLYYATPGDQHFDRAGPSPGATFFPETGHNLSEPFLTFWRTNGEVAELGYPVSEPFYQYNMVDTHTRFVQYFERARLEIVVDEDGTERVELGALGLQRYLQRYGKLP
jgi:hypothetical protein